MKLFFCESCGKRVTDLDIEAGKASDKQLAGVYCSACAQGVTTQTDLPAADAPLRDHKKIDKPAPRRPSGAHLAPVAPAPRVPRVPRRVPPAAPAGKGWDPRILVSAVAGVVLLLLGGILVFGSSSTAPRARKSEPAETPLLPAPEPVPSRHAGGLSALAPPNGTAAPFTSPVPVPTGAKPAEANAANAERRKLEEVLSFAGIPPGDEEARKAKLAAFVAACKDPAVAARARSILERMGEPTQEAAAESAENLHHHRFEEGLGDWESTCQSEWGVFEGLKCLKLAVHRNNFIHLQLPVPIQDSSGIRLRVEYFLNGARKPGAWFTGTEMNRDIKAEPWREGEWAWATMDARQAAFSGPIKTLKFYAIKAKEGGYMLVRQAIVERLTATPPAASQAAEAQPDPSAPLETNAAAAPKSAAPQILSETHFENGLGQWLGDSNSKLELETVDGKSWAKVSAGDRGCRVFLPIHLPDAQGVRVRFEYRLSYAQDPAVVFCHEGFRKSHVLEGRGPGKWAWAEISVQQAGFSGTLSHLEIAATSFRRFAVLMLRQVIVERVADGVHQASPQPATTPAESAVQAEAAPAPHVTREEFLRLVAHGDLGRAEALLEQAEAETLTDERKAELARDRKTLGWARDLEAAVEAGIGKLNEVERFELRLIKGLPVLVGTATHGRVAHFKDGKLAITSDKLGVDIALADLDEDTLRDLTQLGLGRDAGGYLRRAFAIVLDRLRGKEERTKEAQQALDVARRMGAPENEVAYLTECLQTHRSAVEVQPEPKVVAREEDVRAPGLVGEYFKDRDFKELGLKRTDEQVNFRWAGIPAPGIPEDNFSVRWTGMLRVDKAGEHEIMLSFDDLARMKLDGAWVCGTDSGFAPRFDQGQFKLNLTEGWHPIVLELVDNSRVAAMSLKWRPPGAGTLTPIPAQNFSHMITGPSAAMPATPQATLVAHWTFDEAKGHGFLDVTRSGHFGNLRNMRNQNVWSPEGVLNSKSALLLDGTDDFGEVAHKDDLNAFPMTLSLWFKMIGLRQCVLASKYKLGSDNGFRLAVFNNKLRVKYGGGEADCITTGSAGIDAGRVDGERWYHVAMCVDESGMKVYVDGEERAAKAWPRTAKAPSNTEPLLFGTDGKYFLEGQLDDVRIYRGALSAAEVQALCAKPEGRARMLLHWPFENSMLKDQSGNGRDGTLNKWHSITHGVHMRAVRFSNTNHYAQLAHDDALNAFPLSVSVFLRLHGPGNRMGALASKFVHNSQNGWAIAYDHNEKVLKGIYCRDANNRIAPLHHSGEPLEVDKWYHVVYCVEERGARFVIDGKPGAWKPWVGTPGPPTSTCEFTLSQYGGLEDSCLDGELDELRIYQGTLRDAEILELGKP